MGGTLAAIFKKQMQAIDGSLPAIVISYDRVKNLATVRPLIAVLGTDGSTTKRAQVAAVPVLALGGGGFVINFPLKPGDTGWIKANDRDISLYMQSSKDAQPNSSRIHSFADAQFIPDAMAKYTLAGTDDDALVIQSYDGLTKITLTTGVATVAAPLIKLVGAVQHTGHLTNTGGISINGIEFNTHVHPGIVRGTSNTDGPI